VFFSSSENSPFFLLCGGKCQGAGSWEAGKIVSLFFRLSQSKLIGKKPFLPSFREVQQTRFYGEPEGGFGFG